MFASNVAIILPEIFESKIFENALALILRYHGIFF